MADHVESEIEQIISDSERIMESAGQISGRFPMRAGIIANQAQSIQKAAHQALKTTREELNASSHRD